MTAQTANHIKGGGADAASLGLQVFPLRWRWRSVSPSANAADKKTLAFVVNGASDFWKIAEAGVKKAQGELPNYDLAVQVSRAVVGRHPARA